MPGSEENRRVLLDQLSHLVDEVEALRSQVDLIPDAVLKGRPLKSDPSFNEIYLLLARFDENIYTPAAEQLSKGHEARIRVPDYSDYLEDEPASESDIAEILDYVQDSRRRLVALLDQIPLDGWARSIQFDGEDTDLFGLAYTITQHDAALQQAAAYRLHESRLTDREEDLPK